MARITLERLAHSYEPDASEPVFALEPTDMEWLDGHTYALLGPSGCGKTTMLNIVSGLLKPTSGQVLIDGRDVTNRSPRHRNIAQVFQFPVIYGSMTVAQNLAFPLVCRKLPAHRIRARVGEIAELLNLTDKLDRPARDVGVDEKQMISLGRGLVREDVAAILMDEPLTVIDPQLKFELRRKLKQVNEELNMTLIYVTHDQNEAMTFAETIIVMNAGRVVQIGGPKQLFERPRNTFVGYFIGSPAMNLLPCRIDEDGVRLTATRLQLPYRPKAVASKTWSVGIRPEFVRLSADGNGINVLAGHIVDVQDLGNYKVIEVETADGNVFVKVPRDQPLPERKTWLTLPAERLCLYADDELVEGD